jgi:hypothetical protein
MRDLVLSVLIPVISLGDPGELAESCICALAAILPQTPEFPIAQYCTDILRAIPARDSSANHSEIMRFFLFLASVTDCQPTEPFLAVLDRFFAIPAFRLPVTSALLAELRALATRLSLPMIVPSMTPES